MEKSDFNMGKKCILILLDGLGDRSCPELSGMTPLQAADTPNLDRLAKRGANGLYHASFSGQALPSEIAHILLFGYDMAAFPGRGPLEALGADIPLELDDVAILARFASLHNEMGVLSLVAKKLDVTQDEIDAFCGSLEEIKPDFDAISFILTGSTNGVLILKGDYSPYVTDSDPLLEGDLLPSIQPWDAYKNDGASITTAKYLTDYLTSVHLRLSGHPLNRLRTGKDRLPINGMITQRGGRLKNVLPFNTIWGLRGFGIASGIVYKGLYKYLGMDGVSVSDSEDPGRDMAERIEIAENALPQYDFIHLHTKVPDDIAHTKNPVAKKDAIESLDKGIGRSIDNLLSEKDVIVAVTSDHSTPSIGPLIHSGEPVPVTICGRGVRKDKIDKFDEISAADGSIGFIRGKELMYMLLNYMDRSKLVGLMDTPVDQPFTPGAYRPFCIK